MKKVFYAVLFVFVSQILYAVPNEDDVKFFTAGSYSYSPSASSRVQWTVPTGKWSVQSVSITTATGVVSQHSPNSGEADITWNGKGKHFVTIKVIYQNSDGVLPVEIKIEPQVYFIGVKSLLPEKGQDIGADTYGCKTFLAKVGEEFKIIATPDPEVAENELPSDWTFIGGVGEGKFERTVNMADSGTETITVSSGYDYECVKIIKVDVIFSQEKVYVPENDAVGRSDVYATIEPEEAVEHVAFVVTGNPATVTKKTTENVVDFIIKGDRVGFGQGTLSAKIGNETVSEIEIIRVDLIPPTVMEMVNSKTKTLTLAYTSNPAGTLEYIDFSTVKTNVGTIESSNVFVPGGNEKVFSGSARTANTTGVSGKIKVSVDGQYVNFTLNENSTEHQVKVTNAPATVLETVKPLSPAYDSGFFTTTGTIKLLDIDDTAIHYNHTVSLNHDGIDTAAADQTSVTFVDDVVTVNGNEIIAKVAVGFSDAKALFRHLFSLSFSVGAGVEAGIIISNVSFNAGMSGNVDVEIPGSRASSAASLFLAVITFPSPGTTANSTIRTWITNTLSNLLNKTKVNFDVSLSIIAGGNVLNFNEEMDFSSQEATGNEAPVFKALRK